MKNTEIKLTGKQQEVLDGAFGRAAADAMEALIRIS